MRNITEKKSITEKITAGFFVLLSLSLVLISAFQRDSLLEFMEKSTALSAKIFYNIPESTYIENSPEPAYEEKTETTKKYTLDDTGMMSTDSILSPSADNEDVYSDSPEKADISFEDEDFEPGGEIVYEFYGKYDRDEYIDLQGGGQVRNLSHLSENELLSLSKEPLPFEIKGDGSPEVLIMHTHTTECYESAEREFYDRNCASRVLDADENMTAVGGVIADEIVKCGIGVIHDTTVHDYPDYNGSYQRSRETVLNILEQYPSIKIILDIHRDAIERDGTRIAPVTEIDGRKAAQIMIICGCDDGTMGMENFRENFVFASHLESALESDNPTLTRPILFDYRHYNQDISAGSLLIEVGSHANTLDQAKYSGELIGKSLGKFLNESKK